MVPAKFELNQRLNPVSYLGHARGYADYEKGGGILSSYRQINRVVFQGLLNNSF